MNISPYSTLAAGHYPLQTIKAQLAKALTQGELCYDNQLTGDKVALVVGAKDATCDVSPFSHPIEFESAGGEKWIAIDIRLVAGMRQSVEESFTVRNRSEYGLLVRRAILQKAWSAGAYDDLRNISPLTVAVFARWIPSTLSRRFGIDPSVELDLSIITAFYFLCLFEADTHIDEAERSRFIAQVSRAVNTNYERCEQVLREVPHMGTLVEYCRVVREAGLSTRLERYEPAVILPLLTGSWFGNQTREFVAVSLEHPPTFLTLIYSAIADRTYYQTKLATLVNRSFNKGDTLRVFETNFSRCIEIWK